MPATQRSWRPRDWGFVGGLLAASGVALCGVYLRHSPVALLQRSGIGGLLVGCVVTVTAAWLYRAVGRIQDD